MSLCSVINRLKPFTTHRNLIIKTLSSIKIGETGEEVKRPKKPAIPKITLVSSENVSVMSLEEAQKLSKRRDLKLVKIQDFDTKTHRPIYKLMTGTEYHAEDMKQRENKKLQKLNSNAIKGEKLLMLTSNISEHDLETQTNKIIKWINKRYEVRVVINCDLKQMDKAENIYTILDSNLKEIGKIVQKRQKGNDLKFQILPNNGNKA